MDMERLPTEEYSAKCAEIQTLRIIFLTVRFFYESPEGGRGENDDDRCKNIDRMPA